MRGLAWPSRRWMMLSARPLARQLDGMRIAELVRREAPPPASLRGEPAQLDRTAGAVHGLPRVGPSITRKSGPTGSRRIVAGVQRAGKRPLARGRLRSGRSADAAHATEDVRIAACGGRREPTVGDVSARAYRSQAHDEGLSADLGHASRPRRAMRERARTQHRRGVRDAPFQDRSRTGPRPAPLIAERSPLLRSEKAVSAGKS